VADAVICADIGTSSLKVAVISGSGEVLGRSRRQFLLRFTAHAASEWLPALKKALAEIEMEKGVCASALGGAVPSALCISGNGPTLVSQDCETLLWSAAVDSGGSKSLFIPRIKAFKERYPDSFAKTSFLYSGPEFLIWQLTGASVTILPEERYSAAYWSAETLQQAGLGGSDAAKMPPFVQPGEQAGVLKEDLCSFAKAGLPVFCGAPDFICALVGTGTLCEGLLCDRAGSSEGLNLCTAVPFAGENIRTLPSVIPGLWNASYLLPESGSRFSNFKQLYERGSGREIDLNTLVQLCIQNPMNVPLLEQGKYLMLQTAMQVRDGLAVLLAEADEKGMPLPKCMTVTGGQASNDAWNQMKSNVTGLVVAVPACTDAELLGDAVFAFTALGLFASIKEGAISLCRIAKSFEPQDL